ncbi:efflux transporter outer membrane subunit [Desulfobulbus elongatus]|uniref:efflux transporter outer membrane subunit n=1 Tax=Desulfobulbus elongatus TaxID=53332 RepID=UPI000684CBAE|nr:efflux transporter outer membrane subunit [Desulfobulbus elongatus]
MFASSRKSLAAGALLFAFGGCTLAPSYQRPDLPVAENLSVAGEQRSASTAPREAVIDAELGWRDFFVDAQLQQLIQAALANNRDLRESALTIEAYQAQYRIQRAALFPSLAGEGYGSKQRTLSGDNYVTAETYSASMGVTAYELDFFGRVRSLKDKALEQYLAMEETYRSNRISLVAEVSIAYLTWLADRELLAITEDTKNIEQESFDLIEQRAREGLATQLDLAQARTSLETAKANLARYQRQVAQDLNSLTLLTGAPLPASFTEKKPLGEQMALSAVPPQLSSQVLLQRPDIVAAEHELKGAHAQIGAARAAFFPAISLTANAGKISGDLSDLFDSGTGSWLFSPSVSLPIFTAGRLAAELDVAKISREITVARYEKAIQTAFREVADALVASETYREQLVAQKANLVANQEYYALARNRYQHGLDSFLTLLDAQRSLYSARQNYLNLQLAQQVNQVTVYKTLGGGWKERRQSVSALE